MSERQQRIPSGSFTLEDAKEKITARRATEAADQMSGVSEIASYNGVLLAGEKPELLPPNLPFLQSLHVGVPKKLFVDGLQSLPDLINQSLSIDHGNLSLDHLIRPIQNRLRYRKADLLGRLQIDDELELRGLFHREIGGLGSL